MRETIGSGSAATVLDFIYDASGRPFALIYDANSTDPDIYYYILNLQGDVVGLIDDTGSFVAEYTYDAWGKVLTATGSLAEINPLRYRGYYYDTETGFYYLQSRYYDPELRRFINADSLASTGQGFVGTNMFAYCLNNPENLFDEAGTAAAGRVTTVAVCDGGTPIHSITLENFEDESIGDELIYSEIIPGYGCSSPHMRARISNIGYFNFAEDDIDWYNTALSALAAMCGAINSPYQYLFMALQYYYSLRPQANEGGYHVYKVEIEIYVRANLELGLPGLETREYYCIYSYDENANGSWYVIDYDDLTRIRLEEGAREE